MKFRTATQNDLGLIVEMLADDKLGMKREAFAHPLPACYLEAFKSIKADPNSELIVAEQGPTLVGTLQLNYITYLTFKGGTRLQIEAVRIHKDFRGKGFGKQLFQWAIQRAKAKGCHLVQLTTNKERDRAKDFYNELGFESTHEGMKLYLKPW